MAAIGTHAPGGLAIDQLLKLVANGRIHGSGTGRTERHHVRPAEAVFRAHLGKPGETVGKCVANV